MIIQDAMLELGQKLEEQKHNIIAHRRLKNKKIQIQSNSQIDFIDRVSKINLTTEEKSKSECTSKSNKFHTLQTQLKTKNIEGKDIKIRMNQTMRIKTKQKHFSKQVCKDILLDSQIGQSRRINKSEEKPNRAKQIEKSCNTTQLEDKHILNWLNKILIECCDQYEFKSGQATAVEILGLDSNSLLSQGLEPSQLSRLYKSLFVYSIGYYNFLKEVTNNRSHIIRVIWKVYAILLEYCAEGDFETMIGKIQRKNLEQRKKLIKQIENRQFLIEHSDQLMKQKMIKAIKEHKLAAEQNKQLKIRCRQLELNFHQMEQAYNSETVLRLAFQHKMSLIYSIHAELNIKHEHLCKQMAEKQRQESKNSEESKRNMDRLRSLKIDKQQLNNNIEIMQKAIKYSEELILQLQTVVLREKEKWDLEKNLKKNQFSEHKDKDKRINQLERQLKNAHLMIQMLKTSQKYSDEEFKKCLNECIQLRKTNQTHLNKVNQMLSTIQQQVNSECKLNANLDYYKRKWMETNRKVQDLKAQIKFMEDKITLKEAEVLSKDLQRQQIQSINRQYQINIQKLKQVNLELMTQIQSFKRYIGAIESMQENKKQSIPALQLTIDKLRRENEQATNDLRKSVSEIGILKMQMKAVVEECQKKYAQSYTNMIKLEQQYEQKQKIYQKTIEQSEVLQQRLKIVTDRYNDLTYQKTHLQRTHKDYLAIQQIQNENIKQMIIKISQYNQKDEVQKRKIMTLEKNLRQSKKNFEDSTKNLSLEIQKMRKIIKSKEGFVHPLHFQDAISQLKRQFDHNILITNSYLQKIEQMQTKHKNYEIKAMQREKQLHQKLKQSQKTLVRMKQEKSMEGQYYGEATKQLQKRIQNLQMLINLKTKEISMIRCQRQQYEKDQDERFNMKLKDKNQSIQNLLKQLERIEDHYQKKVTDYEAQIQNCKNQIEKLKLQHIALNLEDKKIPAKEPLALPVFLEEEENKKLTFIKTDQIEKRQQGMQEAEDIFDHQSESKSIEYNQQQRQRKKGQNWRIDLNKKVKNAIIYYKK